MPPGIEVVVRTAVVMRVQGTGLVRLLAIHFVVIVRVGLVVSHLPVPDDEHAVDIPILPVGNVKIKTS